MLSHQTHHDLGVNRNGNGKPITGERKDEGKQRHERKRSESKEGDEKKVPEDAFL